MDTGTKISAAGHVALLGWLFVGPIFRAEPLPMNVQEVSVISSAQFAAMQAPRNAPETVTDVALPQVVEPDSSEAPAPEATERPEVEAAPTLPQITPQPDPVIEENEAVLPPEPEPAPEPDPVPEPEPEEAVPQQAERVAPEPVEAPDPDAAEDDIVREDVADEGTETPAPETQEATAPPETSTEIVTEADKPANAPRSSLRPPARRPVRSAEAAKPETPRAETSDADSTADAIASAVAEAARENVPLGPPLTGGELEGLRVAVGSCWNVGPLSSEAQETTVTVFVAMQRDGKPEAGSIRMVNFEGGSQSSAKRVFDTARRAILRCGARGFPLPVEKYGQWREIEMTFNPEGMFWR